MRAQIPDLVPTPALHVICDLYLTVWVSEGEYSSLVHMQVHYIRYKIMALAPDLVHCVSEESDKPSGYCVLYKIKLLSSLRPGQAEIGLMLSLTGFEVKKKNMTENH